MDLWFGDDDTDEILMTRREAMEMIEDLARQLRREPPQIAAFITSEGRRITIKVKQEVLGA